WRCRRTTSPRDASHIVTSSIIPKQHQTKPRVLVVFGTRPEAIKLCPLVQTLQQHADIETVVCVTAQHRQMLDQVLAVFSVKPDFDLDLMQPGQTLTALSARLMAGLEKVFLDVRPSLTVVQGDTTTTLCGALCSFYARVPLAHVEA